MELDVGCSFVFAVPTTTHAVLQVEPHSSEGQRVLGSRVAISTNAGSVSYIDSFGNRPRRMTLETGNVEVSFLARLDVSPDADAVDEAALVHLPQDLPDDVLMFLLPSRYCESEQLMDLAWNEFSSTPPGWARVQAINDWVHHRLRFDYGSSSPSHSAASVLEGGVGVCRDFAHLAIALCRALNIPARYVCGYIPDMDTDVDPPTQDFCAWTEVFLGGRWYTFDPRNNVRRIGRVVIGRGRDAADVAMFTSFGEINLLEMTVRAKQGAGASWELPIPKAQTAPVVPADHTVDGRGNTMFIDLSPSVLRVCDTL